MSLTVFTGGNMSPFTVEKAWGVEVTFGVSENLALKKIVILPNESLSRQVHVFKDEIYGVMSGSGRLELGLHGQLVHVLSEGDAVHLPPGVIHRLVAGEAGLTIIEASTPETNDIIRIEDAYNRQVNPDFDVQVYKEVFSSGNIQERQSSAFRTLVSSIIAKLK